MARHLADMFPVGFEESDTEEESPSVGAFSQEDQRRLQVCLGNRGGGRGNSFRK